MPPIVRAPKIQQSGSPPMRDDVWKSWFRVNGVIQNPDESPAIGIPTNEPLINRFVHEFPFQLRNLSAKPQLLAVQTHQLISKLRR